MVKHELRGKIIRDRCLHQEIAWPLRLSTHEVFVCSSSNCRGNEIFTCSSSNRRGAPAENWPAFLPIIFRKSLGVGLGTNFLIQRLLNIVWIWGFLEALPGPWVEIMHPLMALSLDLVPWLVFVEAALQLILRWQSWRSSVW